MVTVNLWAVNPDTGDLEYNGITVRPNQNFIFTVEVCADKTGWYDVVLDLLDNNDNFISSDWLKSKGAIINSGECGRFNFALSYPRSGKIVVNVMYTPLNSTSVKQVWKGTFPVKVESLPQVIFKDSALIVDGHSYAVGSTVHVKFGLEVTVTATAVASKSGSYDFVLYDQYSGKALTKRTVTLIAEKPEQVEISLIATQFMNILLKAEYSGKCVGIDGEWIVNVKQQSQPTPPPNYNQPQPTPPEQNQPEGNTVVIPELPSAGLVALGVIVGAAIVLILGGDRK